MTQMRIKASFIEEASNCKLENSIKRSKNPQQRIHIQPQSQSLIKIHPIYVADI